MDRSRCGTTTGYRKHLAHNDEPCAECRAANAAYTRELRTREVGRENARRTAARGRALTRLGHQHPEELAELLDDELKQSRLLDYMRGEGTNDE